MASQKWQRMSLDFGAFWANAATLAWRSSGLYCRDSKQKSSSCAREGRAKPGKGELICAISSNGRVSAESLDSTELNPR